MRFSIFITVISFLCSSATVAQDTSQYNHVYRFQLRWPRVFDSIFIHRMQNGKSNSTVEGKVMDNTLQPLPFLTITLKNKDTIIYTITDEEGYFKLNAIPSSYKLTIAGIDYLSRTDSIKLGKGVTFNVTVQLSHLPLKTRYDISSKQELTEQEIDQIRKCVEENNGRVTGCEKENKYYIVIEI